MKGKLTLSLMTPQKVLLLNEEVDFVCLPALLGEMGVLPGHISTVVQLKEGVLRYKTGKNQFEFSTLGGFAEVGPSAVLVLAEAAELAREIDEERARQAYRKAKDALSMKGDDFDLDSAQAALNRSVVRLKIAEYRRKRK